MASISPGLGLLLSSQLGLLKHDVGGDRPAHR